VSDVEPLNAKFPPDVVPGEGFVVVVELAQEIVNDPLGATAGKLQVYWAKAPVEKAAATTAKQTANVRRRRFGLSFSMEMSPFGWKTTPSSARESH
jgi:hypothetical protein